MKILIACEFSGRVRESFHRLGHNAWSCDLIESNIPGQHYKCDIRDVLYEPWDLVIAHPPCNDICSSGARYFAQKRADGRQQQGIDFFMMFTWLTCKWAIENPVGIMSTLYRKPDQIIQPYYFGYPEAKATCLWLNGLPLLESTNIVEPIWHKNPDGTDYRDSKGKRYSEAAYYGRKIDRAKIRSITYQCVADQMALQWGGRING